MKIYIKPVIKLKLLKTDIVTTSLGDGYRAYPPVWDEENGQ